MRNTNSIKACIMGIFSMCKKLSPWPKACASYSRSIPRRSPCVQRPESGLKSAERFVGVE
jgi:hypothetical protein